MTEPPKSPGPPPKPAPTTAPSATTARIEPKVDRKRHTGLYLAAFAGIVVIGWLIALIVANTRQVTVSWVVDESHVSLVWLVLAVGFLGWLTGILTALLFRRRSSRPKTSGAKGERK